MSFVLLLLKDYQTHIRYLFTVGSQITMLILMRFSYLKALRTHNIRLFGPNTILYRAFGLFGALGLKNRPSSKVVACIQPSRSDRTASRE